MLVNNNANVSDFETPLISQRLASSLGYRKLPKNAIGLSVLLTTVSLIFASCVSAPVPDWEVALSAYYTASPGSDYIARQGRGEAREAVELVAGSTPDIRNTSGKRVGYVDGNDIRDASGKRVGYVDGSDIRNASGKRVGYVDGNDIRNASGKRVGYVDGNDIRNASGKRVGYIDGSASRVKAGAAGLLLLL